MIYQVIIYFVCPTTEDYLRHRLELGVAEGAGEVPVGSCFPLEYNGDYLNGGTCISVTVLTFVNVM